MPTRDPPAHVVVRRPMNDHGTMTVERRVTNEIRHVCEYATPELRRRLALCADGTELLLSMSRIGGRSNIWRVTAVAEDQSADPADVDGRTAAPPGGGRANRP